MTFYTKKHEMVLDYLHHCLSQYYQLSLAPAKSSRGRPSDAQDASGHSGPPLKLSLERGDDRESRSDDANRTVDDIVEMVGVHGRWDYLSNSAFVTLWWGRPRMFSVCCAISSMSEMYARMRVEPSWS